MKKAIAWVKKVVGGFIATDCCIHAAGLTYFAMLAVVPVLCCILVVAKACNVDDYARKQINSRIDTMIRQIEDGPGDKLPMLSVFDTEDQSARRMAADEFARMARSFSNTMFERISKFDVGTLGWIGFGFLLWTVISSLASVENSFNLIFGVKKARPIWKRAYMYLFLMIVLPVMVTLVMSLPILGAVRSIMASVAGANAVTKWASEGLVWVLESSPTRFLLIWLAASVSFAFFFWMIPNCKVRLSSAWWGGVVTAALFSAWMKLCAVAQIGIAKSSALYGSFALLPIVLAWQYMSWQIVLLGANMVKAWEEK